VAAAPARARRVSATESPTQAPAVSATESVTDQGRPGSWWSRLWSRLRRRQGLGRSQRPTEAHPPVAAVEPGAAASAQPSTMMSPTREDRERPPTQRVLSLGDGLEHAAGKACALPDRQPRWHRRAGRRWPGPGARLE
jgi:hypothetical protein